MKQIKDIMNYIKLVCIVCAAFISVEGLAQGVITRPNKKASSQNSQIKHPQSSQNIQSSPTWKTVSKRYDWVWNFFYGLALVRQNGKYGFIDETGEEVIPVIFDSAEHFDIDGLARVGKNGKRGYIDKTGKMVVQLVYDDVGVFLDGYAWVRRNGKYGYIDKTGKVVIPIKYDDADGFYNGVAKVKQNGQYFYINKNGVRQ